MKAIASIYLCVLSLVGYSQEFEIHNNGLIYSPLAMDRLGAIIEGKNEEFRKCDLNKEYNSIYQTRGMFFEVHNPNKKVLRQELLGNICIEDFLEKYTAEKIVKYSLITKNHYINRKDEATIRIKEQPDGNRIDIKASEWDSSFSNNWIFDFSRKNSVEIVYIHDSFKSFRIPFQYSKMIQYSECMIDTTQQIFSANATRTGVNYATKTEAGKQGKFFKYMNRNFKPKKPEYFYKKDYTREKMQKLYDSINRWEISQKEFIKSNLSFQEEFCSLLNEAYIEALENNNSTDEFEFYVSEYISKSKALQLKRNRRVIGGCSMDDSPRIHAMNIAQLSAESFNWDIFLRSHLNIMNDRVDRVSDGSWAWEARKTYIKELEELNIKVLDLILGISFRINDPAKGHYYGSIGRLGRAIAESKEIDKFEEELRDIIGNDQIDDYNRLLIYYLFTNLSYNKDNTENKKQYESSITEVVKLLPEYLRPVIK